MNKVKRKFLYGTAKVVKQAAYVGGSSRSLFLSYEPKQPEALKKEKSIAK